MRALLKEIEAIPTLRRFGRVARIEGLVVEVTGAQGPSAWAARYG